MISKPSTQKRQSIGYEKDLQLHKHVATTLNPKWVIEEGQLICKWALNPRTYNLPPILQSLRTSANDIKA